MSNPIGSVAGLASGIQWRELVDQLIALDTTRRLTPINAHITANSARTLAWNGVQAQITKISDAAKALQDGTAFDAFTATVGASPTSGRTLLSATVGAGAAATTSNVEVVSLAQAAKLSSNVVVDPALALGYSGDVVINQHKVTIAAADSLNAIRDKINGANSGTVPSGVTASILSNNGTSRLVLSSDNTGSAGIEVVDSATSGGVLQQIGLTDDTTAQNTAANGGAQSHQFSSVTASIAAALGVTVPPPSSVTVNGVTISVDLTIDSLASIVAKINAAGGQATTSTETINGASKSRMNVGGTVGGDARTLQLLGLTDGGRANVAQVQSTSRTLQDGAGATAVASTLMTSLKLNGSSVNAQVGDTVTISGTRGDGSVVNINYTVAGGDTLSTFLTKINNNVDGFGSGARTATASLVSGKIVLTDNTTGDSQLAFSLRANNQGGGTLDFGTTSTTVTGRKREITSGTNAQVRVDGVLISRQTNTISDAITGITLNLQAAEAGTTVSLNVARDDQKTVDSVKAFAKTYNDLKTLVDKDVAANGPLAFDSTAKGAVSNMKQFFLQKINGLGASSYDHATIAGVSFDKYGVLQVDDAKLKAVLQTNREDARRLFATKGVTNNSQLTYASSTSKTVAGSYAVNITAASTIAKHVGVGFSGTTSQDSGPDTMSVTDSISGRTININVTTGDTTNVIVGNLNTQFTAQGMSVVASNVGGQVKIASTVAGANSFTVGYTVVGADNTTQIGLPAGTYSGAVATTASKTGAGFSGTMLGDPQADTMSVLDSVTGRTSTINIATGDTTANIVANLNTAFTAQAVNLTASNSGGQVKIQSNLNNSGSYTVSYGIVGYDQATQIGLAAGAYAGTAASVTSTLFSGTTPAGGAADTMTITDSANRVTNVSISGGMTMAQVVTAVNTALTAQSADVVASNVGGQLKLLSTAPLSSNSTFTVAYTVNGANNISTLVPAGTYNGTNATQTGAGFSGTTIGDSAADVMNITDSISGNTANVNVAVGQTTNTIVNNLNTAFGAQGMSLTASNVGGQVKIVSNSAGANSFTVGYTVNGYNNSAQLGIAAGTYSGTASTVANKTSVGFSGAVIPPPSPDSMSVLDIASGKTATINITYGDTTTAIAGALNVAFAQQGVQLNAVNTGGQLEIDGQYGFAGGFTVSYTGTGFVSGQVGFAAGTYKGTDVTGTIGGFAATGVGQTLTGLVGSATEGLKLNWLGSTNGAVGTVDFAQGISGLTVNSGALFTTSGTGTIPLTLDLISKNSTFLRSRADNVSQMLNKERASLTQQFIAMETVLSRLQSMGGAFTSQLASLNSLNSSSTSR